MVKVIKNLLLLILSIVLTFTISTNVKQVNGIPYPICISQPILQQYFPVSGGELLSMDIDDYMQGYNLSITLSNQPLFTYLKPKTSIVKEVKTFQLGLKSHQHEVDGTTKTMVTLSNDIVGIVLRWGISSGNEYLPNLSGSMVVEKDPRVTCFDAVWMWRDQTAIVDCASTENEVMSNIFIVADTANNLVLKKISNPLDLPSKLAANRRMKLLYQNSKRYVFRAYLADQEIPTSNYGEVWSFQNQLSPTLKCKIDSKFMNISQFAMRDFQVDQSTIYILDFFEGVTRVIVPEFGQAAILEKIAYKKSTYKRLGVYNSSLGNRRSFVLGGDEVIDEYDCSETYPRRTNRYSVPKGQWQNLKISEQFVMAQVSPLDSSPITYIYRRGRKDEDDKNGYELAHSAIYHKEFALTTFIPAKSSLLVISEISMVERTFDIPILLINPPNDGQIMQYNVMVIGTSLNEKQYTMRCMLTLKLVKVPADELKLFPTDEERFPSTYQSRYPGQTVVPLSGLILGGNITYGVSVDVKADPAPSAYVLKQNSSNFIWNNSQISFSLFYQFRIDSLDPLQYYLITQEESNVTRFTSCQQDEQVGSIICNNDKVIKSMQSRIISLAATAIYDQYFVEIVAIAKEDTANKIVFFDPATGNQINTEFIVLAVDQKVIDLTIMNKEWLVVGISKDSLSEIAIFDLRACVIEKTTCKEFLRLNGDWASSSGLRYLQIRDLTTTDLHPNLLFISSIKGLAIVEIGRTGGVLCAEILSPATTSQKWKATVGRSSLIISNTLLLEQYDLSQIYTSYYVTLMKQFPLYQYKVTNPQSMMTSIGGNMTYILATDPNMPANGNSVVLIYQHQQSAVLSFFDVYKLKTGSTDILLSTLTLKGKNVITIAVGNQITAFRSFQSPQLVLQQWPTDYKVNITYTNDRNNRFQYVKQISVHIMKSEQAKHLSLSID